MSGIFKAYDIRGIYGDTLTEELATRIGRAFVTFLKCERVVVGRDMRTHSPAIFEALVKGLTMQGANVIDLGLCSTPMSYYGNGSLGADAGIMITASHNTGEWNGLKLSRGQAIPISGATGIADIERLVMDNRFDAPAPTPGSVSSHDIVSAYGAHVRTHAHLKKPVRILADMANAMGIVEAKALEGVLTMDALFDTLDGSFPNHEANPLVPETLDALRQGVRDGGYDFGIAFDGDADRCGFVDEQGNIAPMDLVTALIAEELLAQHPGVILYDLRSSWAVKEVIEENGGTAVMCRVGHAFIKQQMRDHNAVFAGELSGHYYFRDNFFTESSSLAALCVANIVSRTDKPLSELLAPIRRYAASGEINLEVADADAVLDRIRDTYADGRVTELDGVSVEYDDWWFNIRRSNTEPLVRLNLEARTRDLMTSKRDAILTFIRNV